MGFGTIHTDSLPPTAAAGKLEPMVRQRARIRFGKQGDLRLVGHRDLARSLERLFRRAGLRLQMSEGFHPKPRISFPSALALGIEGRSEVMELELAEPVSADELLRRLSVQAIPGLEFHRVEILAPGAKKARVRSVAYEATIPAERRADLADQVRRVWGSSSCPVQRCEGDSAVDVRQFLEQLTLQEGVLRMRLRVTPQRSAGPRDVLAALALDDLEQQGWFLTRSEVELEP